jgi:hypothetical protein
VFRVLRIQARGIGSCGGSGTAGTVEGDEIGTPAGGELPSCRARTEAAREALQWHVAPVWTASANSRDASMRGAEDMLRRNEGETIRLSCALEDKRTTGGGVRSVVAGVGASSHCGEGRRSDGKIIRNTVVRKGGRRDPWATP